MKFLIFGLGNIGEEYANTRHNIGFVVLDAIAQQAGASFEPEKYGSVTRIRHKARHFVLIKPSIYMNRSGKAVKYWMQKEKVPPENILIILDDLALPPGKLRLKKKGGDGGHNGLLSIIEHLGTIEFPRLRIGIGDDFSRGTQVDYVLSQWTKKEEEIMVPKVKTATELIKSFGTIGIERTMNAFNDPKGQM